MCTYAAEQDFYDMVAILTFKNKQKNTLNQL